MMIIYRTSSAQGITRHLGSRMPHRGSMSAAFLSYLGRGNSWGAPPDLDAGSKQTEEPSGSSEKKTR